MDSVNIFGLSRSTRVGLQSLNIGLQIPNIESAKCEHKSEHESAKSENISKKFESKAWKA